MNTSLGMGYRFCEYGLPKVERDGVLFDIKDERRKEAETKVKQWLRKIKLIQEAS